MNDELKNAYGYFRARKRDYYTGNPLAASLALEMARESLAKGETKRHYSTDASMGAPFMAGSTPCRWTEDYAALGFRFAGHADELNRDIGHRGWFSDIFQDATIRGAVFLLPGRKGETLAFPGYLDPNNKGAACIALEDCERMERAGDSYAKRPDLEHVARSADHIAQSVAESELDYSRAWHAGNAHAQNMERIAALRKDARAIVKASRENGNSVICGVLRDKVQAIRAEIAELSQDNESLRDGSFSRGNEYLGFYTGSPEMKFAFNDGAGGKVIA